MDKAREKLIRNMADSYIESGQDWSENYEGVYLLYKNLREENLITFEVIETYEDYLGIVDYTITKGNQDHYCSLIFDWNIRIYFDGADDFINYIRLQEEVVDNLLSK